VNKPMHTDQYIQCLSELLTTSQQASALEQFALEYGENNLRFEDWYAYYCLEQGLFSDLTSTQYDELGDL
jgi:hypothetical protein